MSSIPKYRELKTPASPPQSPHREAPTSPHRRRQFFELSEEAAGEMPIEDHIYLADYYRSTSMRPRIPLPMMDEGEPKVLRNQLFDNDSNPTHLCIEIEKLLAQHGLEPVTMRFRVLTKPGYIETKNVTLVIVVDLDTNGEIKELSQVRRAVRSLLQDVLTDSQYEMHVEILDPARSYQPALFSISPHDVFIKIYESFREDMIADVESALGRAWTSMCLYKIGNTYETSEYAVVIMVLPYSIHDWQSLKASLREKYIRFQESPRDQIAIHIVPGRIVIGADSADRNPGKDISLELQKSFPNMGCSIGVEGEWGGGNLGAFMTLAISEKKDSISKTTRQSETVYGFLTASHVVQPPEDAGEDVNLSFHKSGVDWTVPISDPRRAVVRFPAQADFEATRQKILSDLELNSEQLEDNSRKMEEAKEYGYESRIEKLETARLRLEKSGTALKKDQSRCESLPIRLGRTYWASGRALHAEKGSIDVAFVQVFDLPPELRTQCAKGNVLPEPSHIQLAGHLPIDYLSYYPRMMQLDRARPATMVHEFGEILKGQWYHKTGRTTGLTSGVCHGTEAYCRMDDIVERQKTIYSASGEQGEYKDHGYTTELIIIRSKTFSPESRTQGDMQRIGDSGCMLIDWAGRPAGVGFAGIIGQCGPFGYEEDSSTQSGGDMNNQAKQRKGNFYGASISIVTSIPVIQRHLQQQINGELRFW